MKIRNPPNEEIVIIDDDYLSDGEPSVNEVDFDSTQLSVATTLTVHAVMLF